MFFGDSVARSEPRGAERPRKGVGRFAGDPRRGAAAGGGWGVTADQIVSWSFKLSKMLRGRKPGRAMGGVVGSAGSQNATVTLPT